jgi:hypothetical protein
MKRRLIGAALSLSILLGLGLSVAPFSPAQQVVRRPIAAAQGFVPSDIASLDWWLIGDNATISGVPEFDWPDSSSANLPYGQNTSSREPTLTTIGTHQAVQFASGQCAVADPTQRTLGSTNTLIIVATKSSSAGYLIAGTEAGNHGSPAFISGFNNGGIKDFEYYNDFGGGGIERATFAASTDTALHILTITRTDDSGNYQMYFDGAVGPSNAVCTGCDWSGLSFRAIGAQTTTCVGSSTSAIAETLHFSAILNTAQLNNVHTYLGTKYSISVTLN